MVSYLRLLSSSKNFTTLVHTLLCIIVAEVIVDDDTKIKGIQIGDREINTANFADDTKISSNDFSCLTKTIKLFKKSDLMDRGI